MPSTQGRYTAGGKRLSSMAHAKHPRYCSCGRVIYGNGYTSHMRVNPSHRRLSQEQWEQLPAVQEQIAAFEREHGFKPLSR